MSLDSQHFTESRLPLQSSFILGFYGKLIPDWLFELSTQIKISGIILFDYSVATKSYDNNISSLAQLAELCSQIHQMQGSPKIYIDQEGGKVRRLKEALGFKPFMSHFEFQKLNKQEQKNHLYPALEQLKNIGIDVNLAPVIDINYNPQSPDIGVFQRSFSGQADQVRSCAQSWFDVAKELDLELCLKHYPGLGGAYQNSHNELTDLSGFDFTEQENLFFELLPQVPGKNLLLSHALIKNWDDQYPVSISKKIVDRIKVKTPEAHLITDDMQMQALLDLYGLDKAIDLANRAGVDAICIGNNLKPEESFLKALSSFLKS